MRRYLKNLLEANKTYIQGELVAVRGLMQQLMKPRNTGNTWTREEIREIRKHLKKISSLVPVVLIFLLPGGALLLPVLAEVVDRRKNVRRAQASQTPGQQEPTQAVHTDKTGSEQPNPIASS